MAKKTRNPLDRQIEALYYAFFTNVQIMMMDIPKVSRDIKAAIESGTVDETMPKLVEKYRVKEKTHGAAS